MQIDWAYGFPFHFWTQNSYISIKFYDSVKGQGYFHQSLVFLKKAHVVNNLWPASVNLAKHRVSHSSWCVQPPPHPLGVEMGFKWIFLVNILVLDWFKLLCIIDAVTSSGILKAKQKLGVTFNSDKLGDKNFTKSSHLDHVQWVWKFFENFRFFKIPVINMD